jgi:hypothetical protein
MLEAAAGRETLERSQAGGAAHDRDSCTLEARRLKYSEMLWMLSAASSVILGKVGAAHTEAASAETRSSEACIVL